MAEVEHAEKPPWRRLAESIIARSRTLSQADGGPVAVALIVSVGAALATRLPGYDSGPLWLDESWRANIVLNSNWPSILLEKSPMASITSIGYAALNGALNAFFPSSWLLRLTSLLPSIASVALFMLVVTRLTGSRMLGCGAALAAALNLTFIYHAREFKPYALELFVHLSLIYLALYCTQRLREGRSIGKVATILMLLAPPLASLTAANSVFILPGYFLLLGIENFRTRKQAPWPLVVSGSVCFALLVLQYIFLWAGEGHSGLTSYWSANFYPGGGTGLVWRARQFGEMIKASLDTHVSSTAAAVIPEAALAGLKQVFGLATLLSAALGVASTFTWRRPERFLLVLLPLIGVALANWLGIWPLGAVRPNLFAYGYLIILVFLGLNFVSVRKPVRPILAGVMLAWFGGLSIPNDTHYFMTNSQPQKEEITRALTALSAKLQTRCEEPEQVYVTPAAMHSVRYYTTFDGPMRTSEAGKTLGKCATIAALGREAYSDAEGFGAEMRGHLDESSPVWILWSHLNEAEAQKMLDAVAPFATVDEASSFADAGVFRVTRSDAAILSDPAGPAAEPQQPR
jgi:hypothetical protein